MNKTIRRLIRQYHHAYALVHGYFWLPCPLCKVWHGGHEWHNNVGITTDRPGITMGICNICAEKITARHPIGSVIEIDPKTKSETAVSWTVPENCKDTQKAYQLWLTQVKEAK